MTRRCRLKFKLLGLHDPIPEMEIGDFAQLMRQEFSIYATPDETKRYAVRFTGCPYNPFVPDCPSILVFAHNRGTKISPIAIMAVLGKFQKNEQEFRSAYNAFFSQPSLAAVPDRSSAATRAN